MREERKMILDMLAKGKISVEQAEALLEALNGPRNDGAAGAGYAHGARGSDRAFEETAAAGRGHMHGSEGRRGGRAFDQRLIADRIAKVAAEMGEAGQELPMRLSSLLDSLVNLASRFGYNAEVTLEGLVEQDREIRRIDLSTTNGSIKLRGGDGQGYRVRAKAQVKGVESRAEAQSILEEGLNLVLEDGTLSLDCADKSILSSLSVDVVVPKSGRYDVMLSSRNGSIAVEGLQLGSMEARSANGRITMERVQADSIRSATKNGSLQVSGDLGDASLETANGSIMASLHYEKDGSVRLSTGNGSIRLEIPKSPSVEYTVSAGVVNGTLRMEVDDAGATEERSARPGHVRRAAVTVPGPVGGDTRVDVDAQAMNGSITVITV
ncbi:MAG: DUF4097 family beta strand repeat protein [Firmicutes bacterium]|nr:DUF4097 family beta strand repeat protein [Bacillota bacterium]